MLQFTSSSILTWSVAAIQSDTDTRLMSLSMCSLACRPAYVDVKVCEQELLCPDVLLSI